MDSKGRLRHVTEEELVTMEDLDHPVDSIEDVPPQKLSAFRWLDHFRNRAERRREAKEAKISWSEYQIYKRLLAKRRVS